MASRTFELLDVPAKLLSKEMEAMANIPSQFLWKRTKLLPRFLGNEQVVGHSG
jgi:hypothetical protein